jgi:hypothetical protein
MTSPEHQPADDQQDAPQQVPPTSPAYSTPPPEGLPDADND